MMQAALFSEAAGHDVGCKKRLRVSADVRVEALVDGCYRYTLMHVWNPDGALVMYLMANPSLADDTGYTDATVAKCGRLARRWGYDGLLVGNVCAYRSTQPKRLLQVPDPVGPDNDYHLLAMAERASLIVVAHGKLPGKLQRHAEHATELLAEKYTYKMSYLKRTPGCANHHPLYLPEGSVPIRWGVAA